MSKVNKRRYSQVFKEADKDKSGTITTDELGNVLNTLGKDHIDVDKTFERLDLDHDGTLDQTEFLRFMEDIDSAWIRVQSKTFSRWANTVLTEQMISVDNILVDFVDGTKLIPLVEILTKKKLGKYNKKPKMTVHKIENISKVIDFLKNHEKMKLVNIGPVDIQEGNNRITLGLIWMLILKYQIGDSVAEGSPKWVLLEWVKKQIKPYNLNTGRLKNFKMGWSDGKVLSALTDSLGSGLNETLDTTDIKQDPYEATKHAMDVATEKFEIPCIMDATDLVENPEEHSIMTYVSYFRDYADTVKCRGVARLSIAEGPGVEGGDGTAESASFTVICKNIQGNQLNQGDQDVNVIVTGPDGEEKKCELVDNKDGTYSGNYDLCGAGDYTVDITLDNEPISGSPYKAHMEVGNPGQCYAEGEGLTSAKTGRQTGFTIYSVDKDGKPVTIGGFDSFMVQITGPNGVVKNNIENGGDGTYPVTYCPEAEGEQEVNITLHGEPIKNSPFTVAVKRAPNASESYVDGPGLSRAYDNREATFTVHAVDDLGNPVWGDLCEVSIDPENPDSNLEVIDVKVADNEDGTYTVSYSPTVPGNFVINVLLDKQAVKGTPQNITVKEGADSQNIGNAKFLVTINTKNKAGELKTEGGDEWEVEIKGPNEEQVVADAIDNGDGTYSAAYTLERKHNEESEPSEFLVSMILNGEHIAGSPFKQLM